MADRLFNPIARDAATGTPAPPRMYVDMGDGSWAERVAASVVATGVSQAVGSMVRVSAAFTRPANNTSYTAKDAVSDSTSAPNVLTFVNAARAVGKGGYVVGVRAMTDLNNAANRLRLHLFHTAPAAINDNAPYTLLWANRANRIGAVDLPAFATEDPSGSTASYAWDFTVRVPFVAAVADSNIYALVETLDAFTPGSAQQFYFELAVDQT